MNSSAYELCINQLLVTRCNMIPLSLSVSIARFLMAGDLVAFNHKISFCYKLFQNNSESRTKIENLFITVILSSHMNSF